jgi:hypothetical protein
MRFELPERLVNIAHIPHLLFCPAGLVIGVSDLHIYAYPDQTWILIGTRQGLPMKELGMFKSRQYPAKTAECGELLKGSTGPDESRKLEELQDRSRGAALADEEEYILRCLGAAIIMQWNALPTALQREIFDTAGSVGKLLETAALRGQIARFLHKHKNDAGCNKPLTEDARREARFGSAALSRFKNKESEVRDELSM